MQITSRLALLQRRDHKKPGLLLRCFIAASCIQSLDRAVEAWKSLAELVQVSNALEFHLFLALSCVSSKVALERLDL